MGIHAHGVRAADRLAFRPGLLAEWTRRPEAKALTLRSRVQRHKCLCSLRKAQAPETLPAPSATIQSDGHQADVAQLVEQLIRNQQVIGSSPIVGSIKQTTPTNS